ncbi:unnamed protein product, partial [Didymodactylos carnosus]
QQQSRVLFEELRSHFLSIIQQDLYRNYFTLFSVNNLTTNITNIVYDQLLVSNSMLNPFFSIRRKEQSSTIIFERQPSLLYQFTIDNIKDLLQFVTSTYNLTSIYSLLQFEIDFNHLLSSEQHYYKTKQYEIYTEQSFIIKR